MSVGVELFVGVWVKVCVTVGVWVCVEVCVGVGVTQGCAEIQVGQSIKSVKETPTLEYKGPDDVFVTISAQPLNPTPPVM